MGDQMGGEREMMNKMKKIIVTLAMLAAMFMPALTSTSAHEHVITKNDLTPIAQVHTHDESGVMPRLAACGNCGKSSLSTNVSYSGYYGATRTVRCAHYPYGEDIQRKRDKITVYKCASCGFYDEYRTVQWVVTSCAGHR